VARPPCPRRVAAPPRFGFFKPAGVPVSQLEELILSVDELEALRLADLEGLYQDRAATRMGVSRATFARIVEGARHKVAETLVRGRALRIAGGPVAFVGERRFRCLDCHHEWTLGFGSGRPEACPTCAGHSLRRIDRPLAGRAATGSRQRPGRSRD
jgi:predicted DNA-binding protein (UPF0251 family)